MFISEHNLTVCTINIWPSPIFWHLKMGTFAKSARFQVPKNGTSSARILEQIPKTSRNTPQFGRVDIWFMHFHFRASFEPIFENHVFRDVLAISHQQCWWLMLMADVKIGSYYACWWRCLSYLCLSNGERLLPYLSKHVQTGWWHKCPCRPHKCQNKCL